MRWNGQRWRGFFVRRLLECIHNAAWFNNLPSKGEKTMEQSQARNLRVGIFLILTISMGCLAVVMLGGKASFFEDRYKLHSSFEDVAGLREGANVRLAGIIIGEVTHIAFSDDPEEKEILVDLSIYESYSPRIREDTVARIDTEGMLGDKYISVTVGSMDKPELQSGAWLKAEQTTSILEYQSRATELLNNAEQMTYKLNQMLGEDSEAEEASIARIMSSVERVLSAAESGEGLVNTLVYDRGVANRMRRSLANLETGSAGLASIAQEVKNGDGFANQLIYGEEGVRLAQELTSLSDALGQVVADLEKDDSLLHALLYNPEHASMVADLQETVSGVKSVIDGVSQGEGTIGLLARDPTLYEDLRSLVGGAQRNKLLRSYIRRTIARAEEEDAASWSPEGAESAE
jgi:phospholipid/cholesterol/gamma-HCH transport system substrate-binding protein